MSKSDNDWGATGTFKMKQGLARLVVLTGDQEGRVYPIAASSLLGRGDDADVMLDLLEISRRHACIRFDKEEGWSIEDLGSANGTWVDGVPVTGKVPIQFGSRLQMGGSLLMVFTHRDVLEDQIHQMQKLEVLGRLASEVAGDLRNMLSIYQANITFLQQAEQEGTLRAAGALDPLELREVLEELDDATRRAGGLTKRLIGFSREEDQERKTVDMGDLMRDVASMVASTLPPTIRLEVKTADRPLPVSVSSGRLHQALMNLCVNARDAMPDGGRLRLTANYIKGAAAGFIDMPVSGQGDFVLVSVTDDGHGMDEVTQGKIFEPFFTTKEPSQGTSLGLATVYAVVKDHGGQINVKSARGRGTTFTLAFPMHRRTDTAWKSTQIVESGQRPPIQTPPPEQLRGKQKRHTTSVGAPRSVLVISSRQEGKIEMARSIRELALEPMWEEGSSQGLAQLSSEREAIAAVIIDAGLRETAPEMLVAAVRRTAPEVPVLLWAADSSPSPGLDAYATRAGVYGVILSPVTTPSLQGALSAAVAQAASLS